MKILFVCNRLITFILNEIIALKRLNYDLYIVSSHKDENIFNKITKPILLDNALLNNTVCIFPRFKTKPGKFFFFLYKVMTGFVSFPFLSLRALYYMLKIYYRDLRKGIENFLDARELFGLKIDVMHTPFSTPGEVDKTYFLSKVFGVPYTLSFRAHDIHEGDNFIETIKKKHILEKASKVITISEYNRKLLQDRLPYLAGIELIHGAIDPYFFTAQRINNQKKLKIISVCRFHEQKGIKYLIEACLELFKRGITYECVLIGEGPEREMYDRFIAKYNVPGIRFYDYLTPEGIKSKLQEATLFVLPCVISENGQRDILANSLKEAMAMQLPVVTTDICGIEELVEHGVHGLLVPPKDSKAIADAIENLSNDWGLAEKMGRAARQKILNDFNVFNEAAKLEKVLRVIAATGGKVV